MFDAPEWLKPNSTEDVVPTPATKASSSRTNSTKLDSEISNTENRETDDRPSRCCGNFSFMELIKRDLRLLIITLVIIVFINIPYLKWVVYPFTIFSTYIHETCHGMAAIMVGGKIVSLSIYPDTSGLTKAYLYKGFAFYYSAGYQGTSVVGFLLLLLRRTKRGPQLGLIGLGNFMILSVLLWIRNVFGIVMVLLLGILFIVAAWKLPSGRSRDLYVSITVITSLNAITSITTLFGTNFVVNGQTSLTDSHSMATETGTPRLLWATIWIVTALVLTLFGFVFAIPGPGEEAIIPCCRKCQDLGCFAICNFERNKQENTDTDAQVINEVV